MNEYEVRPIVEEEYDAWVRASILGFNAYIPEHYSELIRPTVVFGRTFGTFDGNEIVGATRSGGFDMVVPGGATLPCAVVEDVSVLATHRRRGVLTQMMARQLEDLHEKGEPLAALNATESVIYGRFGFGVGSFREDWRIARHHTAFERPVDTAGRVRLVDAAEASELFPPVSQSSLGGRPGYIRVTPQFWGLHMADPEFWRHGGSAHFLAVYEEDGKAAGYAMYRIRGATVVVKQLVAATDEAAGALWRYCFDLDLMTNIEAPARPVDDPLLWMLADPRRLERSVRDAHWLRLVDVEVGLKTRSYSCEGRLVFEVRDSVCAWNEGRLEIEGGPVGAECRRTDANADVILSAGDLAAAYLGAASFRTLASAGRVEQVKPGALERADAMFATGVAPWSPWTFAP
jgi:predicted acetyltransferase